MSSSTIARRYAAIVFLTRCLYTKKTRPNISRICPDTHFWPICNIFGLRVRLVDVIDCAKFYRNRLRGLDSVVGRI